MLRVIKNQKYQTYDEVEKAAAMGRRYAILSSIRHWNELATAPAGDLLGFNRSPDLGVSSCALCMRDNDNCRYCALYRKTRRRCYDDNSPYEAARVPYIDARHAGSKAEKDMLIKRFRRAAEKMIKILEGLL